MLRELPPLKVEDVPNATPSGQLVSDMDRESVSGSRSSVNLARASGTERPLRAGKRGGRVATAVSAAEMVSMTPPRVAFSDLSIRACPQPELAMMQSVTGALITDTTRRPWIRGRAGRG